VMILGDVLKEYYTYRSVTREDVQPYIDAFMETGKLDLVFAADFLKIMTTDEDGLILYLLALHGGKKACEIIMNKGYEWMTTRLFGAEWTIFTNGLSAVSNLAFNVEESFTAQIELTTMAQMTHAIRLDLHNAYLSLANHEASDYETAMKEYFNPYVELKNKMLSMTELEFAKYVAVREKVLKSPVNEVFVNIIEFLSGKTEDVRDKSVNEYLNEIKQYIEPSLEKYYQVFIEPYSW